MNDFFPKITRWYESHCDSVWEHSYGFSLDTLDNPGWILKITGETNRAILHIENDKSDTDWVHIKTTSDNFMGAGGIHNLNEILGNALKWLEIE